MRLRGSIFPLVLAAVVAVVALPASAQTTGAIDGTVSDANGAPLPGASVDIRSPSLQGTRTAVTNSAGRFRFPVIPPGTYTVTAALAGFKKVERNGVKVNLDATATVMIRMEISVTQEIVVRRGARRRHRGHHDRPQHPAGGSGEDAARPQLRLGGGDDPGV